MGFFEKLEKIRNGMKCDRRTEFLKKILKKFIKIDKL
jgi:hypothetical protein